MVSRVKVMGPLERCGNSAELLAAVLSSRHKGRPKDYWEGSEENSRYNKAGAEEGARGVGLEHSSFEESCTTERRLVFFIGGCDFSQRYNEQCWSVKKIYLVARGVWLSHNLPFPFLLLSGLPHTLHPQQSAVTLEFPVCISNMLVYGLVCSEKAAYCVLRTSSLPRITY